MSSAAPPDPAPAEAAPAPGAPPDAPGGRREPGGAEVHPSLRPPDPDKPRRRFPFPLPNGWFTVARADELAGDALLSLHYFGRDLVAFRDGEGTARVLDAYCPHLGAHLGHGGALAEGRLRCPFHHWEFDGEGRCVAVPYAKRVPPKARIAAWPVCERNGFVHVWHHKLGEPPAFEVPVVPEVGAPEWTDFMHREWVVHSCNQELAENSVDPAHFKYVHRTAEVPTAKSWEEGPVFRAQLDYPIAAGGGQTLKGEIDIFAHGPGVGVTYFHGIVETTVVISGTPIDEERVHQRLSFMVKKRESEEATAGLARVFVAEISRQFAEDMPIWEHKRYWDQPALCEVDGPISDIRRWLQQFY